MTEEHDTRTEADTLRACLARYLESGDEEAMEVIVRRTRGPLMRVARRIGAPQDAEDAVQAAYFSLLRKRGQKLDIPVLPWLKTAVIRIAYRQKAKQMKQFELARRLSRPRDAATPLEELASADESVRVRREIARLPSAYRDPIVLRYLHGLSTAEASDLLQMPEATVRTRLHRARHLLRGRLPVPVRYGAFCVPWLIADLARAVKSALLKFAVGSSAPVPVAAVAILVAAGAGTMAGALLPFGEPPRTPLAAPSPEVDRLRQESAELEAERATLEARRRENALRLKTALTVLGVIRGEIRARTGLAEAEIAGIRPKGRPPVRVAELEEVLDRLDWNVIGATVRELVATLDEMGTDLIAGRPVARSAPGRRQELNGIMLRATARIEDGLPEKNTSLANLNPAYVVNVMVAALDAAGRPLTEEQTRAVTREARAASDAERHARLRDRNLEFLVERIQALAERRKVFFAAIAGHLTDAQRDVLWPESIRNRIAVDLLSVAHAYHVGIHLYAVTDASTIPDEIVDRLDDHVPLSPDEQTLVREICAEWIETLPAPLLEVTRDPLEPHGWIRLSRVEAMAPHTARLYRALRTRLDLEERRLHWLTDVTGVIVPLVCPKD